MNRNAPLPFEVHIGDERHATLAHLGGARPGDEHVPRVDSSAFSEEEKRHELGLLQRLTWAAGHAQVETPTDARQAVPHRAGEPIPQRKEE